MSLNEAPLADRGARGGRGVCDARTNAPKITKRTHTHAHLDILFGLSYRTYRPNDNAAIYFLAMLHVNYLSVCLRQTHII